MKKTELDVIRVETALSRFPIHWLAKTGTGRIAIRTANDAGDLMRWEVSHNAQYGAPGPLAYKLDTLILNRRIEEAGRPIPKLVKLGSLNEICRGLGLSAGGRTKTEIKRALYQNAFAAITAQIRYKAVDGTRRSLEFATTRYAVVLTGETLPDGRTAEAVYVILHDLYRDVLNTALTRPLDYDSLRALPPAAQRLYELLSYQMYAALKHGNPTARLTYSEFCLYAPQTRYFDYDHVKKQMHKLHAPHRQSGYIRGVELEATIDRAGRPDWTMIYTPGPKAQAEYQAFTPRNGGPVVLGIEAEPGPAPAGLVAELIARGVTRDVAAALVRDFPAERIRAQLGNLDGKRRKVKDPGAWLASAIRQDFAVAVAPGVAPVTPAVVPGLDPAARQREEALRAYWEGLTAAERARLDAAALAQADPALRAEYEAETVGVMKRLKMVPIRDAYLRARLHLPAPADGV